MGKSQPPRSGASADVTPSSQEASRAALEHRIAELSEALRARDEFVSAAAHELRNPMTPILMRIEQLLEHARHLDSDCPADIVTGLEALLRNIDRYIQRATVLLDVSRIMSGALHLQLQPTDFSALVHATMQRYEPLAAKAGSRFVLAVDDRVVGRWDQLALEQIADNLLSNAIKYGDGQPIDVSLSGGGTLARLVVRDHGIGISEASQARIFDRFERVVTSRPHTGFGIGLWIVRQLAEAMGGSIAVQSRPSKGSTFTVALPRNPSDPAGASA
jgi:two-component system, OmpR family, sensor kinase